METEQTTKETSLEALAKSLRKSEHKKSALERLYNNQHCINNLEDHKLKSYNRKKSDKFYSVESTENRWLSKALTETHPFIIAIVPYLERAMGKVDLPGFPSEWFARYYQEDLSPEKLDFVKNNLPSNSLPLTLYALGLQWHLQKTLAVRDQQSRQKWGGTPATKKAEEIGMSLDTIAMKVYNRELIEKEYLWLITTPIREIWEKINKDTTQYSISDIGNRPYDLARKKLR